MITFIGSRIVQATTLSDMLAAEIRGRNRSLNRKVISKHLDTDKYCFLVDQFISLANVCGATKTPL